MSKRRNTVAELEYLGFDASYRNHAEKYTHVRCSQCAASVINGVPSHEQGCPHQTYECKGCSNRVRRRGAYCEDCE